MKKEWKRNCPECNRELWYKAEGHLARAIREEKVCANCHNKLKARTGCYKRSCPKCNKEIVYKSKRGYFNSKKHNSTCIKCYSVRMSILRKGKPSNRKGCHISSKQKRRISEVMIFRHKTYGHPMLGKHHTEEAKQKIQAKISGPNNGMYGKTHTKSIRRKLRNIHLGKPGPTISPEGLRSLRIKRINEISKSKFEGGQVMPSYNFEACNFFKKINDKFGWNGQYATNGGEYHIKDLGYFVDYYEPHLNLIIEWDEKIHYDIDGNLRERDKIRENEIKSHMKCSLIRIKENNFDEEKVIKHIYEFTTNK